jgi:CheY-like chemotaxis protein
MEYIVQKVMIVEDNIELAEIIEEFLTDGGYTVCANVTNVTDALENAAKFKPDLFVLDMRLADGGFGIEVASQVDRSYNPGILYATGTPTHFELTRENGHACLNKPYSCKDLLTSLDIVNDLVAGRMVSATLPGNFRILSKAKAAA